ncbi:hypothetical protein BLNAU_1137 [Blattamonas nauphoetae]|uniref:Uncharacterized protein n=1 Tax=Blattamonas nauphoetae TaxID=2049346 RepID=A0ABQ9YK74_9EUKA|nr:hypothetical protein BLNAU_1137 [Blattamonas nauphoetae]
MSIFRPTPARRSVGRASAADRSAGGRATSGRDGRWSHTTTTPSSVLQTSARGQPASLPHNRVHVGRTASVDQSADQLCPDAALAVHVPRFAIVGQCVAVVRHANAGHDPAPNPSDALPTASADLAANAEQTASAVQPAPNPSDALPTASADPAANAEQTASAVQPAPNPSDALPTASVDLAANAEQTASAVQPAPNPTDALPTASADLAANAEQTANAVQPAPNPSDALPTASADLAANAEQTASAVQPAPNPTDALPTASADLAANAEQTANACGPTCQCSQVVCKQKCKCGPCCKCEVKTACKCGTECTCGPDSDCCSKETCAKDCCCQKEQSPNEQCPCAEYPFDKVRQDRAVHFLKSLEPINYDQKLGTKLVMDIVPSSAGSLSGFIESILTLSSSSHSTVVTAALSFLFQSTCTLSTQLQFRLMESDIMTNLFATIQPRTLLITGNETLMSILVSIIRYDTSLTFPTYIRDLGVTAALEAYNRREMIFQKVVLPSLFFIQARDSFSTTLGNIRYALKLWKIEGPEVIQSGKRILQALFSDGFEDTLEALMIDDETDHFIATFEKKCPSLTTILGANVLNSEDGRTHPFFGGIRNPFPMFNPVRPRMIQ